ncbi:MAG: MAPEG family protein [Polyangiales bacterium]
MAIDTSSAEPSAQALRADKPSLRAYLAVGVFLSAVSAGIAAISHGAEPGPRASDAVLAPMGALVALTAVVWLVMVVVRNVAVLRGRIDARQFVHYAGRDFDERIERPARTFNNLFQVPLLFYVACLAMMILARVDAAQLQLAWLFVGLRGTHAAVYIGWNHVPTRFATWIAGCLVLGAIWTRLVFP